MQPGGIVKKQRSHWSMKKNFSVRLNGVGCDAVNCRFHGDDYYCHAESIDVGAPGAHRKGETFCSTFEAK